MAPDGGSLGVLERSPSEAIDTAAATTSFNADTEGRWSRWPLCRSNLFRQRAKCRKQQISRVLERAKEITGWEIAVFLGLSAKLDGGSQVLRCDSEEVPHRPDRILPSQTAKAHASLPDP